MPKPLPIRKLRAEMALRDLDLRYVSTEAGVPYTTTSELLSGSRVDPVRLAKISKAIYDAPTLEGVER